MLLLDIWRWLWAAVCLLPRWINYFFAEVVVSLHEDSAEALRAFPSLLVYLVELAAASAAKENRSTGSSPTISGGGVEPKSPCTPTVQSASPTVRAKAVAAAALTPAARSGASSSLRTAARPLMSSGGGSGPLQQTTGTGRLGDDCGGAEGRCGGTLLISRSRPQAMQRAKRVVDLHRLTPDIAFALFFVGQPRKYHIPRWPSLVAASSGGGGSGATTGGANLGAPSTSAAVGTGSTMAPSGPELTAASTAVASGPHGNSSGKRFLSDPVLDLMMDCDDTAGSTTTASPGLVRERVRERTRERGTASGGIGVARSLMGVPTPKLKLYQKVLALDLDGTLVFTCLASQAVDRPYTEPSYSEVIPTVDGAKLYHVWERPHLQRFLSIVAQWYNVVIYTASVPSYADPIIHRIERGGDRRRIKRRFYRGDCTYVGPTAGSASEPSREKNTYYRKDLSVLGVPLEGVMLVDDTPYVLRDSRRATSPPPPAMGTQQHAPLVTQPGLLTIPSYVPPLGIRKKPAAGLSRTLSGDSAASTVGSTGSWGGGRSSTSPVLGGTGTGAGPDGEGDRKGKASQQKRHHPSSHTAAVSEKSPPDHDEELLRLLPLLEALYYTQDVRTVLSLRYQTSHEAVFVGRGQPPPPSIDGSYSAASSVFPRP